MNLIESLYCLMALTCVVYTVGLKMEQFYFLGTSIWNKKFPDEFKDELRVREPSRYV